MKTYAFNFHYNKPASLKAGKPRMSVHFRGKCHIVTDVMCLVPCWSKHRTRQPRCVMEGRAKDVVLNEYDSHATIV